MSQWWFLFILAASMQSDLSTVKFIRQITSAPAPYPQRNFDSTGSGSATLPCTVYCCMFYYVCFFCI